MAPSFQKEAVKQYLTTWLHDMMRPLVGFLVKTFPSIKPDTGWEKMVMFLVPLASAAVTTRFKTQIDNDTLTGILVEVGVDVSREFKQELEQTLKNKNGDSATTSTSPQSGERRVPMAYEIYFALQSAPTVIIERSCPVAQNELFEQRETGRDRNGRPIMKPFPKAGVQFSSFAKVIAAIQNGATIANHGAGCICATSLQRDTAAYEREERERVAAASGTGKGAKNVKSFAQVKFEAGDKARKATPPDQNTLDAIDDLTVLLGMIEEDAKRGLIYCNTEGEFLALANVAAGTRDLVAAGNQAGINAKKAEISTFLSLLRGAEEVGKVEAVFGEGAFVLRDTAGKAVTFLKGMREKSKKSAVELRRIIDLDDFAYKKRGRARLKDIASLLGKKEDEVTQQEVITATTINVTTGRTPLQDYLNPPTV